VYILPFFVSGFERSDDLCKVVQMARFCRLICIYEYFFHYKLSILVFVRYCYSVLRDSWNELRNGMETETDTHFLFILM